MQRAVRGLSKSSRIEMLVAHLVIAVDIMSRVCSGHYE